MLLTECWDCMWKTLASAGQANILGQQSSVQPAAAAYDAHPVHSVL